MWFLFFNQDSIVFSVILNVSDNSFIDLPGSRQQLGTNLKLTVNLKIFWKTSVSEHAPQ